MLMKSRDWAAIEGKVCRVVRFVPFAVVQGKIVNRTMAGPYGLIALEVSGIADEVTGALFHKTDFANVWEANRLQAATPDTEVIVGYSKSSLRRAAKLVSAFMPSLIVWVCKTGAFELLANRDYQPELTGRARYEAERPIFDLTPEVLK